MACLDLFYYTKQKWHMAWIRSWQFLSPNLDKYFRYDALRKGTSRLGRMNHACLYGIGTSCGNLAVFYLPFKILLIRQFVSYEWIDSGGDRGWGDVRGRGVRKIQTMNWKRFHNEIEHAQNSVDFLTECNTLMYRSFQKWFGFKMFYFPQHLTPYTFLIVASGRK